LLNIGRWLGYWDDWRDLLNIGRWLGFRDDRRGLLNRFCRLGRRGSRDPSKKRGGCEYGGDSSLHGCCQFEDGLGGSALRYAEPVPPALRRPS
jgi:hypothetical protein